jgi:hypothetical protein
VSSLEPAIALLPICAILDEPSGRYSRHAAGLRAKWRVREVFPMRGQGRRRTTLWRTPHARRLVTRRPTYCAARHPEHIVLQFRPDEYWASRSDAPAFTLASPSINALLMK